MLIMLYYFVDFFCLIFYLCKFNKTADKDYWLKFKSLFFINFLLIYIGYIYLAYKDYETILFPLLNIFISMVYLTKNALIGGIGFYIRKKMISKCEYDSYLECQCNSYFLKSFIKFGVSFIMVILFSHLLSILFA